MFKRINHYPADSVNYAMRWIVIYPVDSAIQRLNNRGQKAIGSTPVKRMIKSRNIMTFRNVVRLALIQAQHPGYSSLGAMATNLSSFAEMISHLL